MKFHKSLIYIIVIAGISAIVIGEYGVRNVALKSDECKEVQLAAVNNPKVKKRFGAITEIAPVADGTSWAWSPNFRYGTFCFKIATKSNEKTTLVVKWERVQGKPVDITRIQDIDLGGLETIYEGHQ